MPNQLTEMLIDHEGKKSKPYRCTAGKLTIGVGRNLDDAGLSDDEIEYILNNDIQRTIKELGSFSWFPELNQVRQNALIDMCFNLGFSRFSKFKKMLSAIEQGDYSKAADEMLDSTWARQVGRRSEKLSQMMRTG